MKPGTKVIMSTQLKKNLISNNCQGHVREFGGCIGIVEDLVDFGTQKGPEVNVRWQPSNLRYAYHPKDLIVCNDKLVD